MTAQEKERIIQGYMKNLELSRQEAEELFADDYSDTILPEQAELEKKAKTAGRMYVSTEKKRTSIKRERKVDTVKGDLLSLFKEALPPTAENIETFNEVSISFDFQGERYTLKLSRNRKK